MRKLLTRAVQAFYKASMIGLPKKYSFTRYAMYKRLEEVAKQLPREGKVLSISHSTHLCEILKVTPTELKEANYPETNILRLPYPDESFDFVLSDQVFEHIEGDPQDAINETMRVLKKGGYAVHTTCMFTAIHGPGDFWRFTPEGLSYLCRGASRVVESAGWGNPFLPMFTFFDFMWLPVPDVRWHPIRYFATRSRESYPHNVWIVAKK